MKKDLVLIANQNHLQEEDQIDHQEIEMKKDLVLKERKISLKKKMSQNLLVSQITQNTLEKSHQKSHQAMKKKKAKVLKERKNLKVEIIDLRALPSKNIVQKDKKSKYF